MPKIISYTPPWLCRPSPGFHLFSSELSKRSAERGSNQSVNGSKNKKTPVGPVKTIARRGTEIFVVVDNEIRWSDLCMLKGDWEKIEGDKKGSSKIKPTDVGATVGTPVTEPEENGNSYRASKFPSQSPTLTHGSCRFSNILLANRSSSFRCLQMEPFSLFQPRIQST